LEKRFFQTTLIVITTALILFSCLTPAFAQSNWTFQVDGAVNNNLNLTLDQLAAMPSTTVHADIYCGGVFVKGGDWTGVTLSQILEKAEVNPQAESVEFSATDGYAVTISLTDAMRDDVIIAYQLNGQPLSEGLRLVLPGADGFNWIAMITQVTVSTAASPGDFQPPNLNELASTTLTPTQATLTPTPAPTPTPTPTPTPDNQTTTQTATPPIESQPQPQEGSSTSSILEKYAFPLAFAAIMVAAATAVTGYLIRKRRLKNPKT
jgi:hypothetical protein